MTKLMDKAYKYSPWIVIVLSLVAYMAFKVMTFGCDLIYTLSDWQTYVQLLFVVWLNVNMVSVAYDSGTTTGLMSEEFENADRLNNKIISSVNNEMKDFREYIKKLNEHELQSIREDFLFKVGDKKVEELTKKELKEYHRLKPVQHNIYGFNLPLYYVMTKSGQVNYMASTKQNEGKRKKQFKKIFNGLLFGAMTINMFFNVANIGSAFLSLLIISVGLAITFLTAFVPQAFKFRYEVPKKVLLKNTLYNGYVEFKTGSHVLKMLEEEPMLDEKNE